jgi:hypothetical protein
MREPDPFLPRHSDDYLKPRRRWAPIVFLLLGAAVAIRVGRGNNGGEAADWLFVVVGLAIAVQGFDAIRTGKLLGRFPNRWPVDAERGRHPFTFWSNTILYLLLGMVFVAAGTGAFAASSCRWLTD